MMHPEHADILLSLGANLGDRVAALRNAVKLLEESCLIGQARVSSIYQTEPVGYTAQPEFLNIALAGRTAKTPRELLQECKRIELLLGRRRRRQWREREIDIDILLYADRVVHLDDISIPHPRMHLRRFVLTPAAEIAGCMQRPPNNMAISALLKECEDRADVEFYAQW